VRVIVNLPKGYAPAEGEDRTPLRRVVFGRRPTGADLARIGDDEQSQLDTNAALLLVAASVTEFGNLPLPLPLGVLLKLDGRDRAALSEGHARYLTATLGDRKTQQLSDTKVKLAFGLKVGDEVYDVAEFGNHLTGFQEAGLEARGLKGWRRLLGLIALELTGLSKSGVAGASHEGPFDDAMFDAADWFDCIVLQDARQRWQDSFRLPPDCITVED
jgi:hypothetical protein